MANYSNRKHPRTPAAKERRSRRNRRRIWVLQGGLILVLSTVLWRVYDVQKVYGKQLQAREKNYVDASHQEVAERGAILDAEGDKLAYDVSAFNVDIKTTNLKKYANAAAAVLAPILNAKQSKVAALLTSDSDWVRWPNAVMEPAKEKLQKAFAKHAWAPNAKTVAWQNDITFTPTEVRFYPFGDFASNTLGYVTTSGTGVGGVESEYNKLMSGTAGTLDYKQDADGFPLPGSVKVIQAAKPGDNVQLTLNGTIQGFVENQMDTLMKKYHPKHAAIIVTNPQTGAILAMSSRPSFNPNEYWNASANALSENWAVSSVFEPGSTFKPIVLAAALATHSVSLNQTFQSGQRVVDGYTINDWNYGNGWGTITYQEALEKSSNVGFSLISQALGWPNLIHYMQLFGFLNKTGVDLPDESGSLVFPPSERGPIQLATSGFGQGIAVTPLQQMAAIGAIANGGKLMKPYITEKITTPSGKVVQQTKPTVVREDFVPKSVLQQVSHTMVLDVSGKDGIDNAAKIAGYEVAGKTGTAQTVNPKTGKYYSNRFVTSFIGYAPANDPKVEVYVTVDDPDTPEESTWGSSIAAPAARNIIQDCLQYFNIPPTEGGKKTTAATEAGQQKYVETPRIVGLSATAAKAKLSSHGLNSMLVGESGKVEKQWPAPGVEVAAGSKMYGLLQAKQGDQVVVPDLSGLSLRDATNLLAALSLNISPNGSGYVTQQSVAPQSKVAVGATIPVTLKP